MRRPATHLTIETARKVRDLREREGIAWDALAERFGANPKALMAAVNRANAVDAARGAPLDPQAQKSDSDRYV